MGPDGAACFHTSTNASRDVAKPAWDAERIGMVCTNSTTFASWKDIIEKLCHESSNCDYQMQKQLESFVDKSSQFSKR